jgi:lipoic acid synthetase
MFKKPDWLKVRHPHTHNKQLVENMLSNLNLNTVCKEANCPNYNICFSKKTATFMIMGTNCTRNCRFCNLAIGNRCYDVHHEQPLPLNPDEPKNIAQAVKELNLKYIVITSVTRDDLIDGGSTHFASVIHEIRNTTPNVKIEVLIPDFRGSTDALKTITEAFPNVISHNMETVKSLYETVRPQADYHQSLNLLKYIKTLNPNIHSKSGIMLGLGETKEQVLKLFDDLRKASCEILTIGQYLAPSKNHHPIIAYIEPIIFDEYKEIAIQKGFKYVVSAPLVRSSYNASEMNIEFI